MKKVTKNILILSGATLGTIAFAATVSGVTRSIIGANINTYTLDKDIKIVKNPDYDIEIVDKPNYVGKSIQHKGGTKKEFKVQAFTDLHLDHNLRTCNYTFSMLARNILHEKPDLVVFLGDICTSSFNEPRTKQFARLMEDLGVYWSAVLGNHEKNIGNPLSIRRDVMLDIWSSYPHCLIDKEIKKTNNNDIVWGNGNHIINLVNNDGITQSLYFLDSGTEMSDEEMKIYEKEIQTYINLGKAKATETEFYDYIKDSQVTWYKETFYSIREKAGSNKPHSTIFTHVPIKEMEDAYLTNFSNPEQGIGSKKKIGAFTDFSNTESVTQLHSKKSGFVASYDTSVHMRRREDICTSPHDYKNGHTPIFTAIESFGTNNALFCGHDHQNNFVLKTDDVFLGYIQPGCYSSNNLYTMGMLGADPYSETEEEKCNGAHLIQGYSILTYKDSMNNESNILTNIEHHENIKEHGKDLYKKALDLIKDQLLSGKNRVYKDSYGDYLEGQTK